MKQLNTEPLSTGEVPSTLFAAANSGRGFVSFYDRIFGRDQITRRYIVKGGPGTGKSSFMRQIARYAEEQGMAVEYYRCSSDPDSLDGIVLDGRIAMMDGTAPHTVEPELPGARDEIVNLGEFWDGERLAGHYNEIVALSALKSNCYRKAYRFLSAAMEVELVNRELIRPSVRHEKMRGAVGRLLRAVPDEDEFRLLPGLVDSIGMKGSVRLDTYEKQAKRLYVVEDHYGTGGLFLNLVVEEAQRKGCAVRVSYQPLTPELPDAVYFCQSGVCFVIGEYGEREPDGRVNMKRFLDVGALSEVKVEYRLNRHLIDGLIGAATEALTDAGRHHFALEQIYVSCMDFDSQRKFVRSFCQKVRKS